MKRTGTILALAAVLAASGTAGAVGLDGPAEVLTRVGVTAGAGLDQVGGYGEESYPFLELAAHAERRLLGRLYVAGAASFRQDLDAYSYALERWRGARSPAVAAQLLVGYDGPSFHLSVGPWFYGAGRRREGFRAALLPYGPLRLRIGSSEGYHFSSRVAEGAPFTAAGGALGARFLLGLPPRGRHRASIGPYTTIGEKTVGLALADELASAGPRGTALHVGGTAGVDLDAPTRPELTVFAGLVF